MTAQPWLPVTEGQALRFFFEHLRDIADVRAAPESELLYNASVLAHFATTSTAAIDFARPTVIAVNTWGNKTTLRMGTSAITSSGNSCLATISCPIAALSAIKNGSA